MPLVKHKSRSLARVQKRTTTGKTIHYRARKKGYMSCAICKSKMLAVSNTPNISKSSRRPSRIFGGNLCHKCSRIVIGQASKIRSGTMSINEVDILLQPYVKGIVKVQ